MLLDEVSGIYFILISNNLNKLTIKNQILILQHDYRR
jgi:hypothetical protein